MNRTDSEVIWDEAMDAARIHGGRASLSPSGWLTVETPSWLAAHRIRTRMEEQLSVPVSMMGETAPGVWIIEVDGRSPKSALADVRKVWARMASLIESGPVGEAEADALAERYALFLDPRDPNHQQGRENMKTGTIKAVVGALTSGIRTVVMEDGERFHVDAGFGMRQLVRGLGPNLLGREIEYAVDELGLLVAFAPTGEEA